MRRFAFIILAIIGLIMIAGAGAALFLFNTPPGRDFIASKLEPVLGETLGGTAHIGRLSGAPPGRIILSDVEFVGPDGLWLRVKRLELAWRPLALLRERIEVDRLVIDRAHLLRSPPENDEDKDNASGLSLPDNLPAVRINAFDIIAFQSDLTGAAARLDGRGAIAMGGRMLQVNAQLTSQNGRDSADILIDIAPGAERIVIDTTISSAPDGVIAALTGIEGPLYFEAGADSPANAAEIQLAGVIDAYGSFEAMLSGDMNKMKRLSLQGAFTSGERLATMNEIAGMSTFDFLIDSADKQTTLTINRLDAALGAVSGDVVLTSVKGNVRKIDVMLNADFAENYRTELQTWLGKEADIAVILTPRKGYYDYELEFISDIAEIDITQGKTDLNTNFSGELLAHLKPREGAPYLYADATLAARLEMDTEDKLALNGLSIDYADGSAINGVFAYSFDNDSIDFDGDVDAAPGLVAAFAPFAAPEGATTAEVTLSGPLDRFTAKLEATSPRIIVGDGAAPPLIISAAIAGLPRLPTGDIIAKAKSGPGRFEARLRASENGAVRAPMLQYSGEGFSLGGDAAFNRQTGNIAANLAYRGEDGAEPWPGVLLSGEFKITGNVSTKAARTDLTVTATLLSAREYSLAGLTLSATGSPDAIAVDLKTESFLGPFVGRIDDLSALARVNTRDGVIIDLNALDGVIAANAVTLKSPARIRFTDNVSIETLRLGWGMAGEIALEANLAPQRWRAEMMLSDVNIPETDGRISANLSLDTSASEPARGNFALRSLLGEAQVGAVKGVFGWDGNKIAINSAPDQGPLDMRLSIPANLQKSPNISVDTDGALDGYARYGGRIDLIAGYLPPFLQTLEGAFNADINIAGAIDNPQITGRASLKNGAFTELQSGLSFAGLHLEAEASYANRFSTIAFTGGGRGAKQNGKDTILLKGDLVLQDRPQLDMSVTFDEATFSAHPVSSIKANGKINITGPLDALAASGSVTVNELNAAIDTPEDTGLVDIKVVTYEEELNGSTDTIERNESRLSYDLKIDADDRIFVRGRGVESEWSASVQIVSEKNAALILGAMNLRRGWLDFSGRRFDLTKGRIQFDRLSANNPLIEIVAELETSDGVTAVITIAGRVDNPTITLTSTPSLPSEDIMALVLFGKPAGELTALESLQAAQALASLGGIGPFGGGGGGVTGAIRQATGLDLLNIDIDPENGGGSLTVGKYVAEGFFVAATQDALGENGSVRIEYEITDNISLETEARQDGDQTISVNWKRDF